MNTTETTTSSNLTSSNLLRIEHDGEVVEFPETPITSVWYGEHRLTDVCQLVREMGDLREHDHGRTRKLVWALGGTCMCIALVILTLVSYMVNRENHLVAEMAKVTANLKSISPSGFAVGDEISHLATNTSTQKGVSMILGQMPAVQLSKIKPESRFLNTQGVIVEQWQNGEGVWMSKVAIERVILPMKPGTRSKPSVVPVQVVLNVREDNLRHRNVSDGLASVD